MFDFKPVNIENCAFRCSEYGESTIVFMYMSETSADQKEPYEILAETDLKPVKMTALYMLNDWWTRPAFIRSFQDIPKRTQVLLIQSEKECFCILPLAYQNFKTQLAAGTDTSFGLRVFSNADIHEECDQPLFVMSHDISARRAAGKAMRTMAEFMNLPLRTERPVPEMLKYLGWCSWDAFYRDVNEEGLIAKAEELSAKNIPARWMLIDDGWLSTEGMKLKAYEPDRVKFPHGFLPMTEKIRKMSEIEWFGVWHAVCGFWEGIAAENSLDCDEALHFTEDGNIYPDPVKGTPFYMNWYEYLKKDGISFVKVDGQSTVANFFRNYMPAPKAAEGIARDIETASQLFDCNVINCMGMAMESIAARKLTGISRNSDDFVPAKGMDGFREHLLQNAWNSLYHNILYTCDWDMFWTKEADAVKHSLIRALSGGPVYFSDRVDESVTSIFRPMTYLNGEIPSLERSLMPSDSCVFEDPLDHTVLKLHNYGMTADRVSGGFLLFNLTDSKLPCSFSPDEIEELDPSLNYIVYDWFSRKILTKQDISSLTLDAAGYGWYVLAPQGRHMAVIGRSDLYAGFTAVEEWDESDDHDRIVLKESGPFCFCTGSSVSRLRVNGIDRTDDLQICDNLCFIDCEVKNESAEIVIEWN